MMRGVEEHHPPIALKSRTTVDATTKIFSAILAVSLFIISLYSINLTTTTQAEVISWSNISMALAQNQTFSYPVDFYYGERFQAQASSYEIEIATSDFANSISGWAEYYLFLDFKFNQTYQLNVTVRESSSKVISSARWDGDPGAFGAGTGAVITYPGSYKVEIKNISTDSLGGKMGIRVLEQRFHRPLIYYGLGGLVTVILYPIIILLIWCWTRKRKHVTASKLL